MKSDEDKRIERLAEQRMLVMEERRVEQERREREKREKEEKAVKEKAEKEAKEKAQKEKEEAEKKRKEEEAAKAVKHKPLQFRDAVGRKYVFPFSLCNEWTVSTLDDNNLLPILTLETENGAPY